MEYLEILNVDIKWLHQTREGEEGEEEEEEEEPADLTYCRPKQ